MKKRLLVISTTSRIPIRTLLIAKTLEDKVRVDHLCWQRYKNYDCKYPQNYIIIYNKFIAYCLYIIKFIISSSYDLILFSDYRLLPFIIFPARLKGIKIIYDRQEVPTSTAADKISNTFNLSYQQGILLFSILEKFFCRFIDGILSIPLVPQDLNEVKKYHSNFAVLANVPDLTVKKVPFHIPELQDKKFIIYSGEISENTGLNKCLQLIKNLRERGKEDVMLLLIGKSNDFIDDELKILIEKAGVTKYTIVHQWISYNSLLTLIEQSMIGLAFFDNRYNKFKHIANGTSRKLFTYMACGIPIISNEPIGHIVVEENCGLIADFDDDYDIYSKTLSLLQDENKRITLGRNGKKAITMKYNWQYELSKIHSVYESLWQ
jgi:glycosyltransferase involved in cell wall biosynthesis